MVQVFQPVPAEGGDDLIVTLLGALADRHHQGLAGLGQRQQGGALVTLFRPAQHQAAFFQRPQDAGQAGHADQAGTGQLAGAHFSGLGQGLQRPPLLFGQLVGAQIGTKARHDVLAGLEQSHGQRAGKGPQAL